MRSRRNPGRPVGRVDTSGEEPRDRGLDRRRVLQFGGIAAAVGAGTVLMRPSAAGATTGAMQFGQENNAGSGSTGLTSSSATDTLHVTNSAGAPGLQARSTGPAVIGEGFAGGGVVGVTKGSGPGVLGRGDVGTGPAVKAEIDSATATVPALEAAQSGAGSGVRAHIDNTTNKSAAVSAQTSGPGFGVNASSTLGIGGKFAGKVAPIQLVPSTAASHPAKGSAGQLFVDHSNRLWFCKGGTNWHQLA